MTKPFVLACGALVRELREVLAQEGLAAGIDVDYLPAPLHNHPDQIVPSIEARLASVAADRPVFLGYADCGTGGLWSGKRAATTLHRSSAPRRR